MTGRAEIIEAAAGAIRNWLDVSKKSARNVAEINILAALRAMHASDPARTVEEWIREIEG